MSTVAHPSTESGRAAATRVAAALRTEAGLALGVGAPAEYERRVIGFFDRTIGGESR